MRPKTKTIIKGLLSVTLTFSLVAGQIPSAQALIIFTDEVFKNESPIYQIGTTKDALSEPISLKFGDTNYQSLTWDTTKFNISGDLSLGQNELKDVVIENSSTPPISPVKGQLYYDTDTNRTYQYDGSVWRDLVAEPHGSTHVNGVDDVPLVTATTKGLMSPTQFQDLADLKTQGDEINRNTIDVQLDLGTRVASSVAYLTYDNPDGTNFVANIENTEYTINDSPTVGVALTGGSDTSPVLNYVYVRESGMSAIVEASTTDPSTQAFNYVPIGEVLLGTVGVSSATYYYVENLTNYIRNFIGDTNNRLRVTGVIYLSGIQLTTTGLEIATTTGTVIHMHEEITYPAKTTVTDTMKDFYYNTYTQLDNVNYDNGTGGNTAIGNGKYHKLFIWGDIYGGLHMERQRKPPTSEYTSAAAAEEDTDKVAVSTIPTAWATVGFPIAHLILKQGDPNVLKIIDLRMGGGSGGTVVGGHTQNTDTGTTELTFTLDQDNTVGDITLVFGAALNESLKWDNANSRFIISDDLRIEGNNSVVGQSYIAGNHAATDSNGVVNIGLNSSVWENLTWNDATDRFELTDDLALTGGITTTNSSSIGNNTGTIAIDSNDWDISTTGAMTGVSGITNDSTFTTSGGAVSVNNNSNFAVNIGTGTSTGAISIGGNANTVAVDSSDWDISTTGAMTGVSGITNDAALTTTGGTVSINNNSNFATNINTGTSTGAVSIGGNANTVGIDSSVWDITTAGVASGFTGITSTGTVNFSGAGATRIREVASIPANCAYVGELVLNLANNQIYACTATGTPGVWSSTAGAGAQDLESVYNTDGDKALTTSNGVFTVNTGTNDFIVTSNDWSVNASGLLTTVGGATINGAAISLNNNSNFATNINTGTSTGAVSIGGGSGTVAVDSSSWDISAAGLATGFTGITSTGNINFTAATSFRMPQAASNPGTCSVGQQYYNTTSNEMRLCTSTNTWTNVGSTTGANYTFAYDTTTQTVATANTWRDITFNTNGLINSWTHTPGTANFTCGATGLYLVSMNAQMVGTSTNATGEIRALFNGTEVAGSQVARVTDNEFLSNGIGSTFLVNATSGQILKFQLTAGATSISIAPAGANATTRPSIKVVIVRIN